VDVEAQRRLAKRISDEQLSVREVEKIVRGSLKGDQPVKRIQTTVDPNVAAAESKLRRRFGTKVRIIQGEERRGKIELEFYDDNDLSRLYDLLMASSEAGTARAF
jgi:ParB family chromosome partitioning protein